MAQVIAACTSAPDSNSGRCSASSAQSSVSIAIARNTRSATVPTRSLACVSNGRRSRSAPLVSATAASSTTRNVGTCQPAAWPSHAVSPGPAATHTSSPSSGGSQRSDENGAPRTGAAASWASGRVPWPPARVAGAGCVAPVCPRISHAATGPASRLPSPSTSPSVAPPSPTSSAPATGTALAQAVAVPCPPM
ncbi:hypothetical protein SAMN04489707_10266 [Paenacidovorax caeni]|uniref:Uncharacterized protein n=1 Tax=Paenacidovorax caeni TaxID=343013 RepID=A0A1I7JG93_9BURK|nr:hypothetical protein SAMN04489707_10266 [Paenacidovorax caeni]